MSSMLRLTICFVQILLLTNAMENRDDTIELFLSISLPLSVKKDEIINVPVFVKNPLNYKIPVVITLNNSNAEYEFIDFDNKVISKKTLTKIIRLKDHSAGTIYYLIRPKVIGNVSLTFKATTTVDLEIIHKTLNVVPEGITQYGTHFYSVYLEKGPAQRSAFELEIPKDSVVPDSECVEVGVVGDIMGFILKNFDNLVRMPTGPGEKTMSTLLPTYLVMKYLKNSKRLTPIVETRMRQNLETGYQNMLNRRHIDGSFSSFGPSRANQEPRNGSTWLTAYVLRFLPHFKEFLNVNEAIIEEGLAYLSKQQNQKGIFIEMGDYLYPSQRNALTLTGAALLAFLENRAYADKYLQNITKGLEFITKNHEKYKFQHIHSLAKYASEKAKYVTSEKQSFIKWLAETSLDSQSKWWQYVFLNDIEITSFNLLMLLDLKLTKIDFIQSAVEQLIAQRKPHGGFASIQNSVVGLIALIKFTKFANYEPAQMDVNIISKDKNETIKLTRDNGILYKSVELPPETKSIKIAAKGKGSALLQIAFQYNTLEDQKVLYSSFKIRTIRSDDKKIPSYLAMLVCVTYVGEGVSSNMALLEMYTPTAYVIPDENLKDLQKSKRVSHIELKDSGSLLVVYFDHLMKNVETCLTVKALRTHAVAMQKPVPIIMYDYYNEDKRAVFFYHAGSKLCDICGTPEECNKCK